MSQGAPMETDKTPEKSAHGSENERSGLGTQAQHVADKLASRADLLKAAFDKVLQYGLQDPSREDFGGYFPSMDTALVDALYDAYKQATALVRSHCQEEYQLICTEHQLLDRLLALDDFDEAQAPGPATTTPASVQATPGRKAAFAGSDSQGVSVAVVHNAESVARRYALRQEAAHLQDMLEKARRTESRLSLTLALRQEAVEKMVATYQRVVTDVKQVYDITRVWPAPAPLNGPST